MKTIRILVGMVFLLTLSGFTFASEGQGQGGVTEAGINQAMKPQTEIVEVGNTLCPVSGDKFGGKMGKPYPIEYNGKTYNLCCKMCAKDFKKDPAKYSKIAEENAQKNS